MEQEERFDAVGDWFVAVEAVDFEGMSLESVASVGSSNGYRFTGFDCFRVRYPGLTADVKGPGVQFLVSVHEAVLLWDQIPRPVLVQRFRDIRVVN